MSLTAHLAPPSPPALAVLRQLKSLSFEAFLVGGGVRDRLLGRAVSDWDIATSARPEQVVAAFPKVILTGMAHGTVTVLEEGEPIEVTTYRVDVGYSDGRHPDAVTFTPSLEEDLARRDFTVNAMAWDPLEARIVDPFDGQGDLVRRCLRAVGEPERRFGEDGLRTLRAVRFAAVLGFEIEPETLSAISRCLGTFGRISAERVRVELAKLLLSPEPARGLRLMERSGLLKAALPELEGRLGDAELAAIERAPRRLEVRLAALLQVRPEIGGQVAARLRFSNPEQRRVQALLSAPPLVSLADDASRRAWLAELGPAWEDAVALARASLGDAAQEAADALCRLAQTPGPLSVKALPIDGRDVMAALGIPPSRQIGALLEVLLKRVFEQPELATRERLLAVLPEAARTMGLVP